MYTHADAVREDGRNKGNYEVDGIRRIPVVSLILHHSAGPEREDWSAEAVIDEISQIQKDRFYRDYDKDGNFIGYKKSRHTHRCRNEEVFTAYTYLMWMVKGEWKITATFWGVEENVPGGTSSYVVNSNSIQLCILGNYLDKLPKEGWIDAIINFFKPKVDDLKAHGFTLEINPHKAFDSTPCPGRINEGIPELRKRLS